MLERTTSCLKVGAKSFSSTCAQRQAETVQRSSRRMLHRTFWTHGAGDLDLRHGNGNGYGNSNHHQHHHHSLPSSDLYSAPPTELPLRNDNRSPRSRQPNSQPPPPSDAILLDFLYPPQALAWLNGVTAQQREPWEKRNARRLPDGFVQASRGYSSKSHARSLEDEYTQDSGAVVDSDFLRDLDVEPNEQPEDDASNQSSHMMGNISQMSRIIGVKKKPTSAQSEHSDESTHQQESTNSPFADSAADLAEDQVQNVDAAIPEFQGTDTHTQQVANWSQGQPSDRLKRLRHMINTRAEKADMVHVKAVWSQYLALAEYDKAEIRLKERLLSWFVESGRELAAAFCVTLYWSIPPEQRSLQVFLLAASAFVSQRMLDSALALHEETLHRVDNSQMVSLKLFEMAMDLSHWKMAVDVVNQHHEAVLAQGRVNQQEIFWIKVLEMPHLLQKTVDFSSYLIHLGFQRPIAEYLPVCRRLAAEVVRMTFQDMVPRDFIVERWRLWHLLRFLRHHGSGQIYEELLLHRLQILDGYIHDKTAYEKDTWSHSIISFLYYYYRNTSGAQLPENLLLTFLNHLQRHSSSRNVDTFSLYNTTIDVVIEDWTRWHGKISVDGAHAMAAWNASEGDVGKVAEWRAYLANHYPSYEQWKDSMWTSVYVHARRSDAVSASKAFKAIDAEAKRNDDQPSLQCWNALIYAQARVDDLDAGFSTLKRLIQSGVAPDVRSFSTVMNMMARRGDFKGVEDLSQQYNDITGEHMAGPMLTILIAALCKAGRVQRADEVLSDALSKSSSDISADQLTRAFNLLLAKYASMRDIQTTMRTYRWMKAEGVPLDEMTYAHLMQVLVNFRQVNTAWSIARSVMRNDGFPMTAVHYAIVIAGFNVIGEYKKALFVHQHMVNCNVRPSLITKKNHLQTKALIEADSLKKVAKHPHAPLGTVMEELQTMIASISGRDLASSPAMVNIQQMFTSLIWMHGARKCLDEVKLLFELSRATSSQQRNQDWSTIQLSAGLMNALYHEKSWEQVEALWRIVKHQVDMFAAPTPVPDFRSVGMHGVSTEQRLPKRASQLEYGVNSPIVEPASADDRAEIGFAAHTPSTTVPTSSQSAEVVPAQDAGRLGPRPVIGRRHILSWPFKTFLRALATQQRTMDMVREFTRLVKQGYVFESIVWNRFVEYLCRSDPPHALLAFNLTERYLIARFPGWKNELYAKHNKVYKSDRATGTEFMRARYLPRGALMVQYRTVVFLARAVMQLRRLEVTGELQRLEGKNVSRFVGSLKLIREKAPRTWEAVRTLPRAEGDRLQARVLRGEEPLSRMRERTGTGGVVWNGEDGEGKFESEGSSAREVVDVQKSGAGDGEGLTRASRAK